MFECLRLFKIPPEENKHKMQFGQHSTFSQHTTKTEIIKQKPNTLFKNKKK